MDLKKARGFQDFLEEDCLKTDRLLAKLKKVLSCYDFSRVDPPLLEYENLFRRTLGLDSDIVSKEMYSFQKGEETLTLRPEGTASVARMLITHKLYQKLPLKLFYYGPMFRHERPQKGRFRQFHQLGVEFLGDSSTQAEVEILSLSYSIIKTFELEDFTKLEINTLGSEEERSQYKKAFKKYLLDFKSHLSEESQKRLESNPLRIWDSKSSQDQNILEKAPLLKESLTQESLKKYEQIKKQLTDLQIPFEENFKLVRGLDYYNDLVFEWKCSKLGSQSAIIAGGRYDNLVEQLGGESVPALGWALGLERLSLLCPSAPQKKSHISLISNEDDSSYKKAIGLIYQLREAGFSVSYRFSGQFSKQMKRASQKSLWALIYGKKEQEKQEFILKNLETGEQSSYPISHFLENIKKNLDKEKEL